MTPVHRDDTGSSADPAGRPGHAGERGAADAPVRFVARSVVGLGGVLSAGVVFAMVLLLVASRWAPLRTLDTTVVDTLNDAVGGRPGLVTVLRFVTDLGGTEAAWVLLSVTVAWLLVRRAPRLAVYVAVTGLGSAVLNVGVKTLVARARPLVDEPVLQAPGMSFPSGHAMGSTILYGVLLLVWLPVVPPARRRLLVGGVVTLVGAVGLTRVALGVHYPSDVLGGWLLGVLWLAVTAAAFRRWRQEEGLRPRPPAEGLAPENRGRLQPAPVGDRPLAGGWAGIAELLTAAVLLWGAFVGLGRLVTDVLDPVRTFDVAVIEWFVGLRGQTLTTVMTAVSHLGGTSGVLLALAVAAPLSLAITRRWAPTVFLLVATAGETVLFLAVSTVVDRPRPPVEQLVPSLPVTSSFPSGHVAATAATYGAIACSCWPGAGAGSGSSSSRWLSWPCSAWPYHGSTGACTTPRTSWPAWRTPRCGSPCAGTCSGPVAVYPPVTPGTVSVKTNGHDDAGANAIRLCSRPSQCHRRRPHNGRQDARGFRSTTARSG